jgi:DNA-binding transcriptional LysR family regulator
VSARDPRLDDLEARTRELEAALLEANETLDAIRNGEVDAVVVGGPHGQIVYTLENADRPYRVLVEQMREGAVTLSTQAYAAKTSSASRSSTSSRSATSSRPC